MRLVVLSIAALLACGGPKGQGGVAGPPAAAAEYAATRWIPARPTYAIAARSLRDVQRAITDAVESFGLLVDLELAGASRGLRTLLGVDLLSADALRQIGVDLEGGVALYSEAFNPTLVVHLTAPEQTRAWLDDQRGKGKTTSELVGDVEIFGVELAKELRVKWAIDRDWMWIHVAIGKPDGTAWFTQSRASGAPQWSSDFEWARRSGDRPALVGFVDVRALAGKLVPKLEGTSLACVTPLQPITRAGFAVELGPKHAALRLGFELPPDRAAALREAILPAPEGWDAAAANAPLAAQWNLDVPALNRWIAPCRKAIGFPPIPERFGVRAARMFVASFDPASKEGTGAAAFDLSSKRYFQALLDEVPGRKLLESTRTFGPYEGRRLAVPLLPPLEYVLDDRRALAAFGEDLLARIVRDGRGARSPLLAIELRPAGLSAAAWAFLLGRMRLPNPERIAERLVAWREGHVGATLDGSRLVLEARGTRP